MQRSDVLNELGFKRIINAAGHYTVYGGSRPRQEVNRVMEEASNYWINMNDLQSSAGRYLHSILGCEDGMVTAGAYSALMIATRTCIVKKNISDPRVIIQIPHITKYSEAFRAAGAELKEIRRASGSDSLANYVDDSTVALVYVISEKDYEFSLADTMKTGKELGVPVIVDASLVDPPISGIKRVLEHDPDLVAISGGKGFNGPNDTGILIGKASYLSVSRDLSFPNYGMGRGMKVCKEQIAGILTAIKMASEVDEKMLVESWRDNIDSIKRGITAKPGIRIIVEPSWNLNIVQPIPRLYIFVGEGEDGALKALKIRENLKSSEPPIITRPPSDTNAPANVIIIEGRCLEPEDYDILVERLNSSLEALV